MIEVTFCVQGVIDAAPCGVPLSVSCHSSLSRILGLEPHPDKPGSRGSAILCASIRSSPRSRLTELNKPRMSASSTQFTRWLMIAVCNDERAWCGFRPGRKP